MQCGSVKIILKLQEEEETSLPPTKSEIGHLMLILPDNIEEIGCQNTILILLEAFRLYNVNQWPKECIENYIHHALGIFLHLEKSLEYLVLAEIFNIFHNCLLFNKEWQRLQSITDSTTLQFQRLKRQLKEVKERKYFNILIMLVGSTLLKLDNSMYNKCIEILLALNFSRHSLNLKDGDESTQMKPTNNHKFNNELQELLFTLAEHRLNIFKHVLAVVIYNLYRREPPLKYKQLMLILEKHKELVDNLKCIESPSSMHIHVVLLILQMTGKVLDAQPIGSNSNRLKVLNNLDIFVRDVDFRRSDVGVTICKEMDKLNGNHLNKKEREIWHNLKNKLRKLQNYSST
uniref:Uncharacterized protein n=1 Tax=Glossina austeni TaxID=7395 RepID=A0A1A9V264_GLOAU